jgi:membrane associated rhomboid family serine protease
MKPKQIIVTALIAALFIIPKEFFFKPDNFLLDMALNIAGFIVGAVLSALIFANRKEAPATEKKEMQEYVPAAPMPEPTKEKDYDKYMPK